MLVRVRLTLPDRPGALGQVTRALGEAGADITQITVLERGDGRAVDDLTVFWPESEPREVLAEKLAAVPGVEVIGVWTTREGPGTYPELEVLKYLTTAGERALATLIDSTPVLFSADWAAAATEQPRTTVHASWRAPDPIDYPATPARPAAGTTADGLHYIAAPLPPLGMVFLLARAEGPAFHRIEVHRLTRILEIFLALPAVERVLARRLRQADPARVFGYAPAAKTR